jgi:hypothetical protein
MRPSRMLVLGLAGLVGLHVFMLAGHGRSHDVPMASQMGQSPMSAHASPSGPPSPLPDPPPPTGHDDGGMTMTVACLAVLAGLLLLLPGRHGQLATGRPSRPSAIGPLAGPELAGARTPSLAELCISLT